MPPVFASYWDELFFCTYASIDWAKLCIVSKLNKVSSYKEALRDVWTCVVCVFFFTFLFYFFYYYYTVPNNTLMMEDGILLTHTFVLMMKNNICPFIWISYL